MSRRTTTSNRVASRWGGLVLLAALGAGCARDAGRSEDVVELSPTDVHVANATAVSSGDGDAELSMLLYTSAEQTLVFGEVDPSIAGSVALVDGSGADGGERIDSIEVRPGVDQLLVPGRPHMVLEDVGTAFEPGSSFEMTVHFESARPRTIDVEVLDG